MSKPQVAGRPVAVGQRLKSSDRREQIITGAVQFFAEVGFEGGTRELAERLKVTQPLLYRYFPNKVDLIAEVYKRVYVNTWRSEWEDLIGDRRLPVRMRLLRFYESYTTWIFNPEWIRIYLFSGLKGFEINQWWIKFVEERLLRRICAEFRTEGRFPSPEEIPITAAELEMCWIFHGGIFYYGVRRDVYHAKPSLPLRQFIEEAIDTFCRGYPVLLETLPNKNNKTKRPKNIS